jgi:sugar phosphate isomerase/epimerase
MRRREFVLGGTSATIAASLTTSAIAEEGVRSPGGIRPAISSSNLQWLRKAEDVARAAIEMAYGAVCVTAGAAPAHASIADSENLKKYLSAIRSAGLAVDTVEFNAEPEGGDFDLFLRACEPCGIKQFVFGPFPYVPGQRFEEQRTRYKRQLTSIAKKAAPRAVRALYRNRAGLYLGADVLDIVSLLGDLDPKGIGLCYDTGQGALSGGNGSWLVGLKAARYQIGCLLCTDATLHFQLNTDQGGAFTGKPNDLVVNDRARNAPRALGGGGGQTNPWIAPNVPLGSGLVDLPSLGALLKDIGFRGPFVVESNYSNGGAENGGERLTLPSAMVLGAMKRDLLTLKAGFSLSGLI